MVSLAQMEIFYHVATWHSFSQAAIKLNVSKGYISQQISRLEKELGYKLLYRSTRHLTLTEEGELFFESCEKIVREKHQALVQLNELKEGPAGHLKITAPHSICNTLLADCLSEFQQTYPMISLTIEASSTIKNLSQHGIDIALRLTPLPDENCIARLITTFHFITCATDDYFKKFPTPKSPEDLLQHNCLIYSADPSQNKWPFKINGSIKITTVQGNLSSTNSAIIKAALLANQGITRLPNYLLSNEMTTGKLKTLFEENSKMEIPLYAIYASNLNIPVKIKCFIDFLKKKMDLAK